MAGAGLKLVNEMLSRPLSVGIPAYLGLSSLLWALIQRANSSLGVRGGWPRLLGELAISLALPLVVFLLRPLRWHLVYRSLGHEVRWFRGRKARILVGVGPGGAIMAGMVAKQIAGLDGQEPEIVVIDREYSEDEYCEVQVSVESAAKRLNLGGEDVGVVVVTPEIHSGDTIIKVCEELRERGIVAPVFAYLWSPQARRRPKTGLDRFVMRTDQRGILPWPNAPAKEPAP